MAELAIITPHPGRSTRPVKEWLSRKEAAHYLCEIMGCPITEKTLRNLASNNNAGNGPTYTRHGWKNVRYNRLDLESWAAKRRTQILSR